MFQKLVATQLFEWEIWIVQQDTIDFHQDYEQVIFHKKLRLFIVVVSVRHGKIQLFYNWLKIGTFQLEVK